MSTTSNEYYQDVSQCESPNSRNDKKFKKKSSYKHVPHSDKPPQVVAKRNARERKRVHAVNQAFIRLRKVLPFENKVQPKLLHILLRKINQIFYFCREEKELVKSESFNVPLIISIIFMIWSLIMMV